MPDHLKLSISIPEQLHELLIAELSDLDFEGFESHADSLDAWIPAERYNDVTRETLERWMHTQGTGVRGVQEQMIRQEVVADRNWNEEWERGFKSQSVGRFLISPGWDRPALPEGMIELLLEPKMSFGTGTHPTTRLALRALSDLHVQGKRVIDGGTGTGILAIASALLGARTVFGFDIDTWSEVNALENIARNGVDATVEIALGGFELLREKDPADLFIANIHLSILVDAIERIASHLAPQGTLLLTGLLERDEPKMRAACEKVGLSVTDQMQEGEWILLRLNHAT